MFVGKPGMPFAHRVFLPWTHGDQAARWKPAWRERVSRAHARYEQKAAIRKKMVAERSVWPINREPDPDGRYALSVAPPRRIPGEDRIHARPDNPH